MKADLIILAGGLGTRLKSVVQDLPKPMAPVAGKPFLHYLFRYLQNYPIKNVILSVGFKHETIKDYFGNHYLGKTIHYSIESEPLGTGGAICKALKMATSPSVFILNGDTFFNVDLQTLWKQHYFEKAELTIAVKEIHHSDRYGTVVSKDNIITEFKEKQYTEKGFINGGVYLMECAPFSKREWPYAFSFETEYLQKYVSEGKFSSFASDGYFIDIGIPTDYQRAIIDFPAIFEQ